MTSPLSINQNSIFHFSDSDDYGSIPYISPGSYETYREKHNTSPLNSKCIEENCISPPNFAYEQYRPLTQSRLETCSFDQLVQLCRLFKVPIKGDSREDLIENILNSHSGYVHSL